MNLLFQGLLFLLPLIPCWVIYKYLKSGNDRLKATILSSVRVRLYGVVVAYIIILLMSWVVVDAEFLGLNISTASSDWRFTLKTSESKESESTQQGVIHVKNGPGSLIYVTGYVDKGMNEGVIRIKPGLRNENTLYLPLALPKQRPELVAIGGNSGDRNLFKLDVYTLEVGNAKNPTIYGQIILERNWPWVLLIFVTLMPIVIVVLLSKIGPLIATITATIPAPRAISLLSDKIYIRLGSASAIYMLVYLLVFIFYVGIPKHLSDQDENSVTQCKKIAGDWFFELYHYYPHVQRYAIDYTGKSTVECSTEVNGIFISGSISEIHSLTQPYADEKSCFTESQVGSGGQSWGTLVAGVVDNNIIGIYTNNLIEVENRDMGLLIMPINIAGVGKWSFYDFKESGRKVLSLNFGDMKMYRPSNKRLPSCIEISKTRLKKNKEWYQ